MTPGDRIRQARKAAGYNQAEFARAVGISPSTLNEIELGVTTMPSSETLLRMAHVLDKPAAWIITGKDGEIDIPSPEEQGILTALRALTPDQRAAVLAIIAAYSPQPAPPGNSA